MSPGRTGNASDGSGAESQSGATGASDETAQYVSVVGADGQVYVVPLALLQPAAAPAPSPAELRSLLDKVVNASWPLQRLEHMVKALNAARVSSLTDNLGGSKGAQIEASMRASALNSSLPATTSVGAIRSKLVDIRKHFPDWRTFAAAVGVLDDSRETAPPASKRRKLTISGAFAEHSAAQNPAESEAEELKGQVPSPPPSKDPLFVAKAEAATWKERCDTEYL